MIISNALFVKRYISPHTVNLKLKHSVFGKFVTGL